MSLAGTYASSRTSRRAGPPPSAFSSRYAGTSISRASTLRSEASQYDDLRSVGPADSISQVSSVRSGASHRSSNARSHAPSMAGSSASRLSSRAPSSYADRQMVPREPSYAGSYAPSGASRASRSSRAPSYYDDEDAFGGAMTRYAPSSASRSRGAPSSYVGFHASSSMSRTSSRISSSSSRYHGSEASTVRPSSRQMGHRSQEPADLRPRHTGPDGRQYILAQQTVIHAGPNTRTININNRF